MRPSLHTLEDDLIDRILEDAKRIMAEVGMEILGSELKQRLLDHGLKTDDSGKRILFPQDVIDKAIAATPKSFTLFNRGGDAHTEIGGDNINFVPGSSATKILDHRTGETRLADSKDFVEYARLCDGLEHIAYLATAFSTNNDIEPQVSDAWRLYMTLTASKKPVVSGAFSEHGVPRMAQMLQLFRSSPADLVAKPMSIFTITPTGKFRYGDDSCQNLIDCVEAGIPVEIVPVTLMGLIAPATPVGALVFHCVDVLAGLTMAQIIRPGAPVLFGGAPAAFHMKAASAPMSAIEAQRLNVAYTEIAKSLGLPTQAYMALSDSKFLDAQAGGESFSSALLAAIAGVNSVSGPGILDFVLTFSLPKLVFDNEVCGQALHFVRPIQVLDDLPVDDLVSELLRQDDLITAPHTLKYWPQELYMTGAVTDRDNRLNWQKSGSKELYERACDEVEQRLAAYTPVETDPKVDTAMRELVIAGLREQTSLPELPQPPSAAPKAPTGRRRRAQRS